MYSISDEEIRASAAENIMPTPTLICDTRHVRIKNIWFLTHVSSEKSKEI